MSTSTRTRRSDRRRSPRRRSTPSGSRDCRSQQKTSKAAISCPRCRNWTRSTRSTGITRSSRAGPRKTTLELDLGSVPEAAKTTLFLTGWVYPTDPAISVSIQQAPERAGFGIQPPSLEVPDGQGGWKTASPFIGFPGGKTKTIAVDLTGMLTPGDNRVRIVTSMELCWDQVFFTVDEPAAEVRETPLKLVSADLHFRGCSARVIHPQHGPERYDYSRVDPMIYSSMEGRFTRYGDVQELLTEQDDRW